MAEEVDALIPYRVGAWLPSDQKALNSWLQTLIASVEGIDDTDAEEGLDADLNKKIPKLQPVIKEFEDLIASDPEINMYFHQMFTQVPNKPPYNQDPAGAPEVRNYHMMLQLMNAIMTQAPEYNSSGVVGCPINAILDWPMGTVGGFAAFLNKKVNAQIKKILNHWGTFLKSPASTYVLTDDRQTGWLGSHAMKHMPNFKEEYQCDPEKKHYGFTSWDNFFTREFREGVRPVASPHDDSVIVNACESAPYKLLHNVKREDQFWIKSQHYSLGFMLANDRRTDDFIGGTIYQAFLSAFSYHRWHSPVTGTIIKTEVIDGTYYAAALCEGFDPASNNLSQGYITQVATRALIFIQADNKAIGLMCFMAVGMVEISSCEVTVFTGQHVSKGQEMGMFHFGGSTHCLIFRPGVNLNFDIRGQTPGLNTHSIPVKSKIAVVQ